MFTEPTKWSYNNACSGGALGLLVKGTIVYLAIE